MYEVFNYRTGEVLFWNVRTRAMAVALTIAFPGTDFDTRSTVKD